MFHVHYYRYTSYEGLLTRLMNFTTIYNNLKTIRLLKYQLQDIEAAVRTVSDPLSRPTPIGVTHSHSAE